MISKRFTFLILTFLSFTFSIKAQSQSVRSLREVLPMMEKKFNVVFTYADEVIADAKVKLPGKATLEITLNELTEQTGLLFQLIGTRYIVITKPTADAGKKLCATLLSSETGEPVIGAAVQSGNDFTITNDKGYFELLKQEGVVLIRSLGFEPLMLTSQDFTSECTPLFMQVSYTTLQEVTVSDVISTGIYENVDGSVTIRPEILGILPGLPQPDALQTLQYMPSVRSVAEAAADLNIRGGTNDQNLILLDGIKVYQTGHFFGLISGINPHIISKINLSRNGTSAYFGEATSGTIQIQSDDQVHNKLSAGAGVNLLYADGYLKVPLSEKMSMQVAARGSLPSTWQTPTYKQYYNRAFSNSEIAGTDQTTSNQDFYFFDTHLKFLYDASSRDKIRATFFNVSNQLDFEEVAQGSNSVEQKKSSLEQNSMGASLQYTRLWSDKVKTTFEGYMSGYSLDAINQNISVNQQLTQVNEVLETGIRMAALIQLKQHMYLQTGYQFFETGITNSDEVSNPEFSRFIKEVNRTHVLFAEGNYSLNEDRTNLRVGLRGSYFSKLNSAALEPRLVINQKLAGNFSAEFLGEIKTQTSVQVIDLQSDFLGVEKRRWLMSNGADVPMLRSKQVSAGIAYNKNELLVSADVFYKEVDGIITSSQGFQNQFEFVRASGSYDIAGLDVLINKKVKFLEGWFGYSLSESNYQFAELIPPAFPNNLDIRHSINTGVSTRINQFEFSAGVNWHSGRPTTIPVSGNEIVAGEINYDSPNSSRLKDYFRVDFSARWHFYYGEKIRSHAGISLWNITNRENVLSQYYQINSSSTAVPVNQIGLAFTPNLFLRIEIH